MQITMMIKDRDLKQAIGMYLDDEIYMNFDELTLKACKVPPKSKLIAQLMENDTYMEKVAEALEDELREQAIAHLEYCASTYPNVVEDLVLRCNEVEAKTLRQARIEDLLDGSLDELFEALEKRGFVVTENR